MAEGGYDPNETGTFPGGDNDGMMIERGYSIGRRKKKRKGEGGKKDIVRGGQSLEGGKRLG